MGATGDEDASGQDPDPFERLVLDEDFIRAAPVREPAAEDRERAARQANLQRLLADEAARRENEQYELRRFAPAGEGPDGSPGGDDAPRPRRRSVRAIALLVVAALIGVYVVADLLSARGGGRDPGGSDAPVTTVAGSASPAGAHLDRNLVDEATDEAEQTFERPVDWPPHVPGNDRPLGYPPPAPAGGGPHAFAALRADGVTPIGYDPCRPIRFVTRSAGHAPAGADQLVAEAMAAATAATGLQFRNQGTTDEAPSADRPAYQPGRYDEQWAPVLIAWSTPEESPLLAETVEGDDRTDVAGYAGSRGVSIERREPDSGATTEIGAVFVTGSVVLDGPDLSRMLERPDGWAQARAVVMHELAHLVGLGHVDDPAQLMHPRSRPEVTAFGPGDLTGLARLGSLECFPEI